MDDLQRQVAEDIMGWTGCEVVNGVLYGHAPESTGRQGQKVPEYSTSLDAAWFVVKEMKKSGYCCELTEAETLVETSARFVRGNLQAFEQGSTPAEAVCRAALAVIASETNSALRGGG